MRPFGPAITAGALLLLGASPALQAQSPSAADSSAAARFITEFYAWYASRANVTEEEPAWTHILKERAAALAPPLREALRADSEAQAQAEGESVGLDFDPFLFSQDPCERYEVATLRKNERGSATSFLAEVHGICDGEQQTRPAVVAELVKANGGWVIANVRGAGAGLDLLAVLRHLRRTRETAP